jgi:MobA/VirD2-like, nuclease domain
MIPRISKVGRSFKGAFQYFAHDKDKQPTRNRIAWAHTENMLTDDPDHAWKVMAYTVRQQERLKAASGQKATGRKLEKPVFSYSLAWHPEQNPDKEHMLDTARKSLAELGLNEHETLFIAHRDEPQKHVHVIVNRVHPITGIAADLSNSKRKLSDFARVYEREHGKVYCQQREDNFEKRKQGKKSSYRDPKLVEAWHAAQDGKSFAAALKEKGYQLARGTKRIVVIDPHGRIHNPTRHFDGIRAKDIKAWLHDVDIASLPNADELSEKIQQKLKLEYDARQKRQPEREQDQNPPIDLPEEFRKAAQPHAKRMKQPDKHKPEVEKPSAKTPEQEQQDRPIISAEMQNRLQTQHHQARAELFNRHTLHIEQERAWLIEFYQIPEMKKNIAKLQEKVSNPSWWRKLFGMAKRDQTKLETLQINLTNVQQRGRERLDWLKKERDHAMTTLDAHQAREKALLIERGPEALATERKREIKRLPTFTRGFDFGR